MQRFVLPLIVFLLFLIQGSLLPKVIPSAWQAHVVVAPNLMLVIILFIGIYINSHWSMAYGVAFGILHDIVYYGSMLGPYSFGMGLTGYLIGLMSLRTKASLFHSMLLILIGNVMFELIMYGIYRVFLLVNTHFNQLLLHQILPSILINLLFALWIYIPIRKLLESIHEEHQKVIEEPFN